MEIKIEIYDDGKTGRVRVVDAYDIPAALIHFGPADIIDTQEQAVEAGKAVIGVIAKIYESKPNSDKKPSPF